MRSFLPEALEYFPAVQEGHDETPVLAADVPAGQDTQALCPVDEL